MAFDFRSTQSCEPIQCYLAAGMQLILFVANSIHVNESFANTKTNEIQAWSNNLMELFMLCVCVISSLNLAMLLYLLHFCFE